MTLKCRSPVLFIVLFDCSPSLALATTNDEETESVGSFHPSRVLLELTGTHQLTDQWQLHGTLVAANNLVNGFAPKLFTGANWKPSARISGGVALGWSFMDNEPLLEFTLAPSSIHWYANLVWEIMLPSQTSYWLVQTEYRWLSWLHTGIEAEGWGQIGHKSSWSSGGGPNVLLRWDNFDLDLALHARDLHGTVRPEFSARLEVSF